MSQPQEPTRPFFQFGNPLRMILPKGSQLSSRLLAILNSFEQTLAQRLRKLKPNQKADVLSLSWMKLAMDMLCETHNDIKILITELELPVSDWEEKWIDVYLNNSVKLLDICIAFSSEISRLNQGHLFLQCALHNMDSTSPAQFVRARSSLDSWRQHISSKNPRVESCFSIMESLIHSLNLPKIKNSAKGKVLMRAMYGVKVETIFVCNVFAAAFTGSARNLKDLHVPDTFLWSETFTELQRNVNGEIKSIFSSGKSTILKELEAVAVGVEKLYPITQDGLDLVVPEAFKSLLSDLGGSAEKLSQGLDHLTKEVDCFFQIILTGRDALLGNLRSSDNMFEPVVNASSEEQVVR